MSVAECERGGVRDEALSFFMERCRGQLGSGLGGSHGEAVNFEAVLSWLQARNRFLWVYEAEDAWHLLRGHCRGRWVLGAECGCDLGGLAWFDEGDVVTVLDADGALFWGVHVRGGGGSAMVPVCGWRAEVEAGGALARQGESNFHESL